MSEVIIPENLPSYVEPSTRGFTSGYYHLHKSRVPLAHRIAEGKGVKVAVLDSGATLGHPRNGRLTIGPSFTGEGGVDRNGHGTHVMGLVWQVAPEAEVISVQVLNENNSGTWRGVSSAIRWCTEQGDIDAISMSLGSIVATEELRQATSEAAEAGIVICAASGNLGTEQPFYPAHYEHAYAVAACDRNGELWALSSTGDVDTMAAGDEVLSSSHEGDTVRKTGTSMACPIAAGVFALAISADRFPTLNPDAVIDAAEAVGIVPQIYIPVYL